MNDISAKSYSSNAKFQFERGEKLIKIIDPRPGQIVVDLGCGTGNLTEILAEKVGEKGLVYAIDPDTERINLAESRISNRLKNNIVFLNCDAKGLNTLESSSVDLVYSNYVLHWVEDKRTVLNNVYRVLKSGGTLAIETVGKVLDIQTRISLLAGEEGQRLINRFHCLDLEQWITMLKEAKFDVQIAEWPVLDFNFDNLDKFLQWWEGTSHGAFKKSAITPDSLKKLTSDYPGEINYQRNVFLGIASKPNL